MCYECAETVQKLSFRHKMTVALLQAEPETVAKLRAKLLDPNTNLPEKYRVLFSLRNLAGQEAHEALLTGVLRLVGVPAGHDALFAQSRRQMNYVHAALKDESALFRHDVAFCLGQRQDAAAIDTLKAILNDPREHAMCVTCCVPNPCSHLGAIYVCLLRASPTFHMHWMTKPCAWFHSWYTPSRSTQCWHHS